MSKATQPLYRVLDVQPTSVMEPGQSPEPGMRVIYQMVGGSSHALEVPSRSFDPENVAALIDAEAARIAQVRSLEGPEVELDEYGRPVPAGTLTATT